MAAGDLTILANALIWLGQADDENDVVSRLITVVSSQIQKFLGYQVKSQGYTRTFNGRGGNALMLPDRPLTAVTSVTIDGVAIPLSVSVFQPGFVFDDRSIFLRGCYVFSRGVQNVQTAYNAGYAATPPEIEQACLDWVKITFDNLDTLPGITRLKAGDSEIDYGEAVTELGQTTILMPPLIAAALQPYRRMTPL